jgi:hypothetical protein
MWLSACSETAKRALWLQSICQISSGTTFVELLAVLTGNKSVVRLVLPLGVAQEVAVAASSFGLQAHFSEYELGTVRSNKNRDLFQTWVEPSETNPRALYLSFSKRIASHAAQLDLAGDDNALAEILGYPCCCIRSYDPRQLESWWYQISLRTPVKSGLPFVINRLALLYCKASYLYDFFPCSFNCQQSTIMANRNRDILIEQGCESLVSKWDGLLSGLFAVFPNSVLKLGDDGWKECFGRQEYSALSPISLHFTHS